MILGMPTETFTLVHVIISLVGIASGLVVLFGWLTRKQLGAWTATFLTTTAATSVTGFFFPFHKVTPAIVVGTISLVLLAVAIFALYARHLAGVWRSSYVGTAATALYLNVFVLVVQLFLKVPALNALAPHQSEPPFAAAQGIVFALFLAAGIAAVKRFHPEMTKG
jgi:hypothetical protein